MRNINNFQVYAGCVQLDFGSDRYVPALRAIKEDEDGFLESIGTFRDSHPNGMSEREAVQAAAKYLKNVIRVSDNGSIWLGEGNIQVKLLNPPWLYRRH